ncbi:MULTISPECIES: 3D domain-containing protein [Paenibacillus]|uniref:3D domain-containing protein n=1 Tax=Paenibacillus TaxID=44249 RepID=UPI0022B89A11|nr:3D domain-containing protein [Paenibacillus caseinilyticus]MCZ8523664.1 3D domain-containing protein [Paenibacillus caseinilyticus]
MNPASPYKLTRRLLLAGSTLALLLLPVHAAYAIPLSHDGSADITCYMAPYDCGADSSPSPSGSSGELPEAIRYEVRTGDTLYRIARSFGIGVSDLYAANALSDSQRLKVGQVLDIPPLGASLRLPEGEGVVSQVLTSTLTAYTSGAESTGKSPGNPAYGITYSGSRAEEGRTVAVDPELIPIGSTVFIDGIGLRKAEDTGSAIQGARIDIYMQDVQQARQFGVKKNVKVYVLSGDAV